MKKFFCCLCFMLLFLFASCEKNDGRKITDRMGQSVSLPHKINRIISTAPSNTEIIIALGLADKLVAVDSYSIDVAGVPDVTKIDFSYPDGETIINLAPDIIIANGHNQRSSRDDPFRLLKDSGIAVVYIPMSKSIEDIYGDIMFLADILDRTEQGQKIVADTKEKIKRISDISSTIQNKKSLYFEISPAPYIVTFGSETYLNEMIELAGAKNIFADDTNIIVPNVEVIMDRNPDVIITNIKYEKDFNPIEDIKSRDGFDTTNAVKNNAVYYVNTNSSSRPTQNIVIALEEMAKQIYPEYYK
ncbi:MAG: ABC transporter substrate-binding protein [Termitinemataceae bacterium]|nr:MAG: ABC transporter substrate-binding protein [Termitinemataceae bacterium]